MGADSLINLHTHTKFSDGDYTPEQIVATAEKKHLTHIAITDHFQTSKTHSMFAGDLENYIGIINELGRMYPNITVLAGVEIDTNPERCDLESLPIDLLNKLDLVLFEYVQTDDGSSLEDLDHILSGLDVPCGLAHNDIERNFGTASPEAVADYLASFGVFVEVNTAWPYKRDGLMFWEKAEKYYEAFRGKVLVSVGTDVHHNLAEVYNLEKPYRFLRRTGLLDDNLVC
jgi:histidinol phosphatase-like PHP family hydrolase